jgi:hypothetical protein
LGDYPEMKSGFGVMLRVLAAVSVAGVCALAGGCSSTTYPAVLADPPGPTDTTLSPDEIKKATDNLISARNHQCTEAIADAQPGDPTPDCGATTTGTTPNAGAAAKP